MMVENVMKVQVLCGNHGAGVTNVAIVACVKVEFCGVFVAKRDESG